MSSPLQFGNLEEISYHGVLVVVVDHTNAKGEKQKQKGRPQ